MNKNENAKNGFPLAFLIVILTFVILMSLIILTLNGFTGNKPLESGPVTQSGILFEPVLPQNSIYQGYPVPEFGQEILNVQQLIQEKQYKEAENTLRNLLILYPGSYLVKRYLCTILIENQKFGEAEKLLLSLLPGREDQMDLLYDTAMMYGSRGDFGNALHYMKRVVILNPDFAAAYLYLSYFNLKTEKKEEAVRCFTTAVQKMGSQIFNFSFDSDFQNFMKNPEIRGLTKQLSHPSAGSEDVHE